MPKVCAKRSDILHDGTDQAVTNRRILYGRRAGHRLSPHQKALLAEALPRLTIPAYGEICPSEFFPDAEAVELEVGFGGGEHLVAKATANPKTLFLGCEPFVNGVVKLVALADEAQLQNVRIHDGDARSVIERLPDNSLACVYVLFPDPWPKVRHWKRRFISATNLDALARVIRPGGLLKIATDIADYARWTMIEIHRDRKFTFLATNADQWRLRPSNWPPTRYEEKARLAGRKPVFLTFGRVTPENALSTP